MSRVLLRPIDVWPGRLRDENQRIGSPFTASWSDTTRLLTREVDFLAGSRAEVVVQIACRDRDLYVDGSGLNSRFRDVSHPGVVVSFTTKSGRPLQFATDVHTNRGWGGYLPGWQSNVRAVALALEALRKVDRYGVGQAEQQYVGWQALPPGTPMPSAKLTKDDAARVLVDYGDGDVDVHDVIDGAHVHTTLVRELFRRAAKREHPDAGGDPAIYRRLVEARDILLSTG